MRVLIAHNFYQQPGGEDQVFASEVSLLRRFGHDVRTFEADNDAIDGMGQLKLMRATIWNGPMRAAIRDAAREHRAQIVHFHNTFPLISPAAYAGAHDASAAVVQTLHNFRLLCPNAVFFRDGAVCERCLGTATQWPGVVHKCYRGSRSASAAVAGMNAVHGMAGTWRHRVDAFIAPTEFARVKFIDGGLPPERLIVKPNFVDPDPGVGSGEGGYAVFVGRLSHEKGLETLLAAWDALGGTPLKIIGDGPLVDQVRIAIERNPAIEWLGRQPLEQVYDVIGRAAVLIFPSRCYETFGRVAVEAYAKGVPVIASRHGAMADVVRDGATGRLFTPGDPKALADAVREVLADPGERRAMGVRARGEYEAKYTGEANHRALMAIYDRAMNVAKEHRAPAERTVSNSTGLEVSEHV
jgi:glycosyltransferase involved in cell wall biosynthesis